MFEKLVDEKTNLGSSNHFDLEKLLELGDWKELFLGLFNVARELFFILDEGGSILSINQFGASTLDYTAEELIGKHFMDLIDPMHTQLVNASINLALKNDNSFFEASLVNRYEKINRYQISIKTIRRENKIIGLLGVGKEVTLQRKLENELAVIKPKLMEAERLITLERARSSHHRMMLDELNKMKSEFVSNISHEMRTPLASIVGFSETIASDPNMPMEMRNEFNLIILNEGKRLAKLINDVLDISRMETGRIALNKSKVNIVKIIKRMIDNSKEALSAKNLILTLEAPYEEILIEADEERLLQALDSLLENSIKFSKESGRIKVILNNLFREVEIVITDTGIGIPEKDLPFLFQKFYRVNRSDSDISGAGMGLVFVKQIVDLHKGLISIQSETNKGTSVLIKLLKNVRD
ncbi:MAG: PAS domain S-box protein [Ignavibacteriaceae bacterium]|nr:PAS domain S-box protein [Ignavibacterium sp.]MCC6254207.1 PAS domain S-box protein [Ignavibacteriaceae bacterium]HMN25894.1 ATP-binding protein [Ignavibacteriaceae bacterium]HRN25830.1 ATP-binding protein [Ignavibacteriaceae bacterium]HRP91425.1 ATP-binding protein [Ignavibacteriaceae bacterium]